MKGKSNSSSGKPRKTIPTKTRAILQKEIKSKCPICPNEDVEHFHIHHIDENPLNNEFSNLLMLCPICHSKITKNDILYETVKMIKENLSNQDSDQ
ncbi:HNH endonuclease signature motif containing protein [Flavobacterium sp. HJJ]|uniref:HNH endonuclease signature motif containing protein n=1 Tax=Flavobacterium sp. HJJ TaxID=2783792 RepID=UPI00188A5133|nr:HNH endonuclease signature motif containing protein [Flavobacterium sp. HJJ]MBF4471529.1 HNH endonuclease [Flavobacterium sp. HJJ]